MSALKRQHCAWCGEFLGEYASTYGVVESCGSPTCEREIRNMEREEEAEREDRASSDDFERYR